MKFCAVASLFLIGLAGGASSGAAQEANWNQFRGPTGDGRGFATNLPVEFSETKNLRWKTRIHDEGWSSPVVWGDQIWLTTARTDGTELFAICVDLQSGKIIHDIKVFDVAEPQNQHGGNNTHATPTPIVEEGRVYVHFGSYGTACLDTKTGETLWENRELKCDHRVRPASSPIIDGDSLFLTFDGVDVQFVASLDKNTGEVLWVKNREGNQDLGATLKAQGLSDAQVEATKRAKPNDNRKSYATPTVIEYEGKKQLISPGAEVTYSYDPETGDENWHVKHEGWGWNVTCRPIFANGLVYSTQGISKRLVAIRPSGSGDVTDTHIEWSIEGRVSHIPSPVIVDGLLFMFSDTGGSVTCLDAVTGEQLWRERVRGGANFWGSPVYADGKIFIAGLNGVVYVFSAGREFELLAANDFELPSGKAAVAPAKETAKAPNKSTAPKDIDKLVAQMRAKGMTNQQIKDYLAGGTTKAGGKSGGGSPAGFIASPAIAGNALILRSETHLYCIAEK